MDPITINRLGQIRHQEILEAARYDYAGTSLRVLHLMGNVRQSLRQMFSRSSFSPQPDVLPLAERCELVCEPVKE